MTHLTNRRRSRTALRGALIALVLPAAALALPRAAQAEEIRIAVPAAQLSDPAALDRVRRDIARAADSLCASGGLAAIYRNGARRCREAAIARAERQLRERIAARALLARAE